MPFPNRKAFILQRNDFKAFDEKIARLEEEEEGSNENEIPQQDQEEESIPLLLPSDCKVGLPRLTQPEYLHCGEAYDPAMLLADQPDENESVASVMALPSIPMSSVQSLCPSNKLFKLMALNVRQVQKIKTTFSRITAQELGVYEHLLQLSDTIPELPFQEQQELNVDVNSTSAASLTKWLLAFILSNSGYDGMIALFLRL